MFKKQTKYILFFIMVLLGFIIALQAKSIFANINSQKNFNDEEIFTQYTEQLAGEKEIGVKLSSLIKQLEKDKEDMLKSASFYMHNSDSISELEYLRLAAGLTAVKGGGVKIVLNDALTSSNINPNSSVVHNTDLINILNLLKKAGAQAISVNGQRIIATSEIVCTGPTVRINRYRYPVPYEIIAIGELDKLYDMLSNSVIVAALKFDGIRVDISKQKEVNVPGYLGDTYKLTEGLTEVEIVLYIDEDEDEYEYEYEDKDKDKDAEDRLFEEDEDEFWEES